MIPNCEICINRNDSSLLKELSEARETIFNYGREMSSRTDFIYKGRLFQLKEELEMNEQQKKAYELAEKNDDLCEVYKFQYDCHGVQNYGNGPSYPPCADGEPERFIDFYKLADYADEQAKGDSENV